MMDASQIQAHQAALMKENPSAIPQFMPPPNFELDHNAMANAAKKHKRIFDDDEEEEKDDDDGSNDDSDGDEEDHGLMSNQDDNEDDSNQQDEYDESEDNDDEEEESSPYARSDQEDLSNNLKNGHSIDGSLSSPEKMENGDSKIEKFA